MYKYVSICIRLTSLVTCAHFKDARTFNYNNNYNAIIKT